ncbi:MAG: hypothetical protein ABIQ74_05975 [Chitinophagales bacterium]
MMEKSYSGQDSLDSLFWREEILQVLYWMQGEGLAEAVPVSRLLSLLSTSTPNLLLHLQKNIVAGYLKTNDDEVNENSSVQLTAAGKKEAGGIFRNAFEGMQKGGHGECGPDCEFCYHEGEKLEDCVHNCADSRHHHHA